jgi:hypothetical protein
MVGRMNLEGDFVLQTDCGVATSIAIRVVFPGITRSRSRQRSTLRVDSQYRQTGTSSKTASSASGFLPARHGIRTIRTGSGGFWMR